MLKTPANRQDFILIHVTVDFTFCVFLKRLADHMGGL